MFDEKLQYERFTKYLVAKVREQIINHPSELVSFKEWVPDIWGGGYYCTIDRKRVKYSERFERLLFYVRENVPDGIIIEPAYCSNRYSVDSMFLEAYLSVSVTNDYFSKICNEYCDYLVDFQNLLVTKRNQELNHMVEKLRDAFTTNHLMSCAALESGFYYWTPSRDHDSGDMHCIISFCELGLKNLSSYSQVYTLSKILADMLSQNGYAYEAIISANANQFSNVDYIGYSYGSVAVSIRKTLPKTKPKTKETNPLSDW